MCSRETKRTTQYNMREWLSGGAPPCQGGGRGFDPRLALYKITKKTFRSGKSFLLLKPKCFAVLVQSCIVLKRPSVVSEQKSIENLDIYNIKAALSLL